MVEESYRKPEFRELPRTEQLAIKIEEAGRKLGIDGLFDLGLPRRSLAIATMEVLNALKGKVSEDEREKVLKAKGVTSLQELPLDPDRFQVGVIIWNPSGCNSYGNEVPVPIPHVISLIRTDFARLNGSTSLNGSTPVLECRLVSVPVGSTEFDWDYLKTGSVKRSSIMSYAQIVIGRTFIG